MREYDHKKIEKKWQAIWEKKKIYQAQDFSKKPKYYSLIEFPYPSGSGLHVGHIRSNTAMDIISRKRRMEGFNVLYPIGWDAFGLPTENYAIKTGIQPSVVTKKNTDIFRKQLKAIGFSFDWSREINTTDPKYYKWTQWIFLQFLKKGLAYKAKMTINWCPKDKIGLANEEVINGFCERCGTAVEKREKEQWMLAITKYADRLYKDLDDVDYLPQIKLGQRNWIGRSEGTEIDFSLARNFLETAPSESKGQGTHTFLENSLPNFHIKVFTTRPDTIFGATFIAIAPEVAKKMTGKDFGISSDIEKENKEKVGVDTGLKVKNPANGEMIPVYVVNYVSAEYGTGAIMAVPAHDERDLEFAKKYNLPIKNVIEPVFVDEPKTGMPFVEREAIHAIVKHWAEEKYLVLLWKKVNWVTFVTGGVENGENPKRAAMREIQEETGYINFKLKKELPRSHSKFYHIPKKENRFAHFSNFYFELKDGEQMELSEEEKENHELKWVSPDEVEKIMKIGGSLRDWRILRGKEEVYMGEGILVNSGKFSGLDSEKVKKEIIKFVGGKEKTTFKLRDWIFSRQRYWGEPIPVIHCPDCGMVPVPEKDLPVELPKVKNYQPTDSGESPLAKIKSFVDTRCPLCKGKAKRETDTMPNWAGSSWYYLRYTDPKNKKTFADKKNLKYWLGTSLGTPTTKWKSEYQVGGVDWYNGGNEHTTLHLLYSRFWHKFLFDLGLVPTSEPYKKRTSHGMILGEGGVKMSKSVGNVINPDDIVKTYGADTLRIYEMFMGPFDQSVAWSGESIIGARRFIEKVWRIGKRVTSPDAFAQVLGSGSFPQPDHSQKHTGSAPDNFSPERSTKLLHKTIKKVSEDIEEMRFNTAISSMMILATEMEKSDQLTVESYKLFLQILSPFAPHVAEELWQRTVLKEVSPRTVLKNSIHFSTWPLWDPNLIKDEEIKIIIQINGKVRSEIMIQADETEEDIKKKAFTDAIVLKHIRGKNVKRIVYIKNRLINIVI